MIELKIKENEAGQRLDKYLHKYMKEAGTGFLYKMLRKKNITLNGKKASGSEKLCVGDAVRLFLSDETVKKFGGLSGAGEEAEYAKAREIRQYSMACKRFGKLEIVFENRHILVVNKPSGILTQKAGAEDVSLNEWLTGYLLESGALTEEELHTFHPSVCNRLDRNTSGMVICGKTLLGSQKISEILRDRSLRKYYRLYVKGYVREAALIEGYLMKEEQTNTVRLTKQAEGASYIKTYYKPLKHYEDVTLLEAELITGKTHQIRLHLSGTGHPVIGDYKYGEREINERYRKKYGVKNQLLHAYRLEFPVMEGEFKDLSERTLVAEVPEIFVRIAKLEGKSACGVAVD